MNNNLSGFQIDLELSHQEKIRKDNRERQRRRRALIKLDESNVYENIPISVENQILLDSVLKAKEEKRLLRKSMSNEEKETELRKDNRERQVRRRERLKLGLELPKKRIFSSEEQIFIDNILKEKEEKRLLRKSMREESSRVGGRRSEKQSLTRTNNQSKTNVKSSKKNILSPEEIITKEEERKAKRREWNKAWRKANPEKARTHTKKYQDKMEVLQPGLKKARLRAYKEANPEKIKAHTKKYQDKMEVLQPGLKKARLKAYKEANPEKFAQYSRTRVAANYDGTDPNFLAKLAKSKSIHIKLAVAGNKYTEVEDLHALAGSSNAAIQLAVAGNNGAGKGTLEFLARTSSHKNVVATARFTLEHYDD